MLILERILCERRASDPTCRSDRFVSRLIGPAPKCGIDSALARMAIFFMNLNISICAKWPSIFA
jgi:hypothetical protein